MSQDRHLGRRARESRVGQGVSQPRRKLWSWHGAPELPEWRKSARPLYPYIDKSLTQAAPGSACDLDQGRVLQVLSHRGLAAEGRQHAQRLGTQDFLRGRRRTAPSTRHTWFSQQSSEIGIIIIALIIEMRTLGLKEVNFPEAMWLVQDVTKVRVRQSRSRTIAHKPGFVLLKLPQDGLKVMSCRMGPGRVSLYYNFVELKILNSRHFKIRLD